MPDASVGARRKREGGFRTKQDHHHRDDGLVLRVPPQSIEAEQAVLGGLMLAPDTFALVKGKLEVGDFYRRDHALIWQSIVELEEKGKPFDAVTMGEWFEAQGMAELVAGGAYLVELASNTPSAANITAYAEIVADKAQLRRLIDVGANIVNDAFNPDGRDSDELIANAGSAIESVVRNRGSTGQKVRSVLNRVHLKMQEAFYAPEGYEPGLSTGNTDLDKALGYLRGGRVYGIGGRPKMGKSTLAGDIACYNAVRRKKHVAVFTYEMPSDEMTEVYLAKTGGISYHLLQHPKLMQDDDWTRLQVAMGLMRDAPLEFHDDPDLTIERISAICQVAKSRGELDLVVIDQLNLMPTPDTGNRATDIGEVTKRVKRLAVRLKVPVILVFQLNRGNEALGKVRPPRASDARDSGAIEQDLDCMILLHRPSYYDKKAPKGCRCEIAIQRNGESGVVVRLEDELQFSRFAQSSFEWVDGYAGPAEDNHGF